jgi:hypothetical protein
MAEKKLNMLHYKGRPLVRSGNTIYLGDMSDSYVAMLQIQETKEYNDMQLSARVSVQILSTDDTLRPKERIKKKTDKDNLYDAINIASIWLERMLEQ